MAIRVNGATNDLEITSDIIDYNADFTVMFWYMSNTDGNTFASTFIITAAASPLNTENIKLASDGTSQRSIRQSGGATAQATGTSLTPGTWYHLALVGLSGTLTTYLNSTSDAVATGARGSRPDPISMQFNSNSVGLTDNYQDMSLYAAKAWTKALDSDGIEAERLFVDAVDTDSLYAYWPLEDSATVTTDSSGNGHTWTLTGAASTVSNPSGVNFISVPILSSNISAARMTLKRRGVVR